MDGIDRLDKLAAFARREEGPSVDVTDGVLRKIRRGAPEPVDRGIWWVAAFSSAAAACAAVYAFQLWSSMQDPLIAILDPLWGVIV